MRRPSARAPPIQRSTRMLHRASDTYENIRENEGAERGRTNERTLSRVFFRKMVDDELFRPRSAWNVFCENMNAICARAHALTLLCRVVVVICIIHEPTNRRGRISRRDNREWGMTDARALVEKPQRISLAVAGGFARFSQILKKELPVAYERTEAATRVERRQRRLAIRTT